MVNEIIGTIAALKFDPGTLSAPAVMSVVLNVGNFTDARLIATGKVGKRLEVNARVGDRIVATIEGSKIISFELNSGK
jgi:hypothetical protein